MSSGNRVRRENEACEAEREQLICGDAAGQRWTEDRRGTRDRKGRSFTELVELGVDSGGAGDRTHQPGLQEGGPAVDQAPLPADVVLRFYP